MLCALLAASATLVGCRGGSSPKALSAAGTWSGPADARLNVTAHGQVVVSAATRTAVYPKLPADKATTAFSTQGATGAAVAGGLIYVIENSSVGGRTKPTVTTYDLASGRRRGRVGLSIATTPEAIAASSDGRTVVVLEAGAAGTDTLSVLDAASGAVRSISPASALDAEPFLAVSPDGSRAYLTSLRTPDQLMTVDTRTARIVFRSTLDGPAGQAAAAPAGPDVYVTSCSRKSFVAAISATSGRVVRTIATPGTLCPSSLAVSPDSRRLYVTMAGRASVAEHTRGTVALIDIAHGKLLANLAAGVFPAQVVPTPDGKRVYVADEGGTVHIYETHRSGS